MGWGVGLIVRDLINGVGGAVWNTDNRDVCIERVQIKTNRKIVKALKLTSGDGGERLCHAVLLMRSGVVELTTDYPPSFSPFLMSPRCAA
jgi:hypothetical protein